MRLPSVTRTSVFRLTAYFAIGSATSSLLLFAFIYWQTAVYERARITRVLTQEADFLSGEPEENIRRIVETRLAADFHRATFAALFDAEGHPVAGNMLALPTGLPADGTVHSVAVDRKDDPGLEFENILAISRPLPGQRILVIGRNIDELSNLREVVSRALMLGVIPAVMLAMLAGLLLSLRTQRRIRAANLSLDRIMQGNLGERLPVSPAFDDFDRVAVSVNRMLDEIQRLISQVKGAVDHIVHDLRAPLARMHTRLERSRSERPESKNIDEFVDRTLADLELTLGVIAALVRIAEIEDGRRRAAFSVVDLQQVVTTVAELYEPIAEEHGVELQVDGRRVPPVRGDYELLIEAIANLVDNAIKFTPSGGRVRVSVAAQEDGRVVVRVTDTGPGIPEAERAAVFQRFYRARGTGDIRGHGLGLSLVRAIADLHRFSVTISDANPGAIFDLVCWSMSQQSAA